MIENNTYDFVMSLGGSCAVAKQLSFCGLRQRSLPFDWLFHFDNQPLDYLCEAIVNGFEHWMYINDLRPLYDWERGDSTHYQYHDNATGYNSIHDFDYEIHNLAAYNSVKEKYARRFKRLQYYLSKSKDVLLILDARYEVDINKLKKIKVAIESKYNSVDVKIILIQFISENEEEYELDWIKVFKHTRNHSIADYTSTPDDWNFIKNIKLKDINFFEGA